MVRHDPLPIFTPLPDILVAALVMYIRSRKLGALRNEPSLSMDLVEQQLEALSVVLNALSLIDANNAYIIVPSQSSGPPVSQLI